MEQFNRLTNAVHHAIPQEHYDELLNLPALIQNHIEEPFADLLELCRSNVIQQDEEFQNIPDPENINLNEFLNNPTVWKTWQNTNDQRNTSTVNSVEEEEVEHPSEEILNREAENENVPQNFNQNFVEEVSAPATEENLQLEVEIADEVQQPSPQPVGRLATLRKRKTPATNTPENVITRRKNKRKK